MLYFCFFLFNSDKRHPALRTPFCFLHRSLASCTLHRLFELSFCWRSLRKRVETAFVTDTEPAILDIPRNIFSPLCFLVIAAIALFRPSSLNCSARSFDSFFRSSASSLLALRSTWPGCLLTRETSGSSWLVTLSYCLRTRHILSVLPCRCGNINTEIRSK